MSCTTEGEKGLQLGGIQALRLAKTRDQKRSVTTQQKRFEMAHLHEE